MKHLRPEITATPYDHQVFPLLTGTPKQVEWAETIRRTKVTEIEEIVAECRRRAPSDDEPKIEQVIGAAWHVARHTDASWWIDNRTRSGQALLKDAFHILVHDEAITEAALREWGI